MVTRSKYLSVAAAGIVACGTLLAQTPAPTPESRSGDASDMASAPPAPKSSVPDALKATAPAAPKTPPNTTIGFQPAQRRTQPVSNGVKSAIGSIAPSFAQETPATAAVTPQADLRDTDKPINDIVRLDPVVVSGARPPIFRERDLFSQKDLSKIALNRYKGLSLLPYISFLNAPIALQMLREDQRLEDMKDISDIATGAAIGGDKETSLSLRRDAAQTFNRQGPAYTSPLGK